MSKNLLLVVNFGGPRNLEEVEPFLLELLTDKDVIRTSIPNYLQDKLFSRIAKKRAPVVSEDYKLIGGGSPIFADTNWFASALGEKLSLPSLTFHRYLCSTHEAFVKDLVAYDPDKIFVFPLFPQFSYATTGSVARWMGSHVPAKYVKKMRWIKSYFAHEGFIASYEKVIRDFLQSNQLDEEKTSLFFSAHGVPVKFIKEGDPYQAECEYSFRAIARRFSKATSRLAFQSKFGRGEWIQPATEELCATPDEVMQGKEHAVFIPVSFSSDHIETLFEIEKLYVKPLKDQGLSVFRCPALGRAPFWVEGAREVVEQSPLYRTCELIRLSGS